MIETLRDEVVIALKEAAEAEAAVWTGDERPVVGTWGDRILGALAHHGIAVVWVTALPGAAAREALRAEWEVDTLAAFLHSESIGCSWIPVDAEGFTTALSGPLVASECRGDHQTEAMAIIVHFTPEPVRAALADCDQLPYLDGVRGPISTREGD